MGGIFKILYSCFVWKTILSFSNGKLQSNKIIIFANNALYDKVSHDTLFYNEVKSEFLNNSIISKNLDVLFTKKISKIYNNVVFENDKIKLKTDKILIDMKTGDIKLEMESNSDKVKLLTKNEYFN